MEMLTVVVFYKQSSTTLPLAYKTVEAAERAYSSIRSRAGSIEITDDFGVRVDIDLSQVSAVSVTNVVKNLEGQADSKVLMEHANAKLQTRLQNDPLMNQPSVFRGNPQRFNG